MTDSISFIGKNAFVVLCLFQPGILHLWGANKRNTPSREFKHGVYSQSYLSDYRALLHPHVAKKEIATDLILTAIGAYIYAKDSNIRNWVQSNRVPNGISNAARIIGDGRYVLLYESVLYVQGEIFSSSKLKQACVQGIESFVLSGIAVNILKFGFHRYRPYTEKGPNKWNGPSLDSYDGHLSFPSGHSSSAFAVATVFASKYSENKMLAPLFYTAAAMCAISRVNDDKHWASDVFTGSLIGLFTAHEVLHIHKHTGNLSLVPMPGKGEYAVLWLYKF